jgi:tetratricopeptide (TPR) repeat protein
MESIGKMLEATLTHYERKEYDAAEKIVDQLIAKEPNFHRGLFLKAVILEERGRAAEAEPFYERAGNRFTLWFRLAMQLESIDPERAVRYYEKVRAQDPLNNVLLYKLGGLYEQIHNADKARECYRQLSPTKEVLSRIIIPLGFLIVLLGGGIAMLKRGDQGFAIVVFASAIFCLFWLKRDSGRTLEMFRKKNTAT